MTEPSIRVTIGEADVEFCGSGASLARAFGSMVLEPSWWPGDIGRIEYCVERFPDHVQYVIRSARRVDDRLISIIGHADAPGDRQAAGHWYAPAELEDLSGRIRTIGRPPRLQAIVHDRGLAIHFIGYDSEAEIVRAAKTLRRVAADN